MDLIRLEQDNLRVNGNVIARLIWLQVVKESYPKVLVSPMREIQGVGNKTWL